jgi:hypothetical protein
MARASVKLTSPPQGTTHDEDSFTDARAIPNVGRSDDQDEAGDQQGP